MDDKPKGTAAVRRASKAWGAWSMALTMLAMVACSHDPIPSPGATVSVSLKDYRIMSSIATLHAGTVSFDVHNRGPSTHEFVVFETARAADQMPLGADGLTIDEDSPLLRHVGEMARVDIGQSRRLTLRLTPGSYVLVCNMEGHYLGGMHFSLVVH
jgi:uncharacterized cupredoxin-like copper-binding protein